jgi:hypothetical protein
VRDEGSAGGVAQGEPTQSSVLSPQSSRGATDGRAGGGHATRRALCADRPHRAGRHGRRLSRPRPAARPRCRGQGPRRPGRGDRRDGLARGPPDRLAGPPAHRGHLRQRRHPRRPPLPGDGADRGGAGRPPRAAAAGARARAGRAGRRGAGLRARAGRGPLRPDPAERAGRRLRAGQADRLRRGQRRRRPGGRGGLRLRRLPGAGAAARRTTCPTNRR